MSVIHLYQWAVRDAGGSVVMLTLYGSVSLPAWSAAIAAAARHFDRHPYGAIVVDLREARLSRDVLDGTRISSAQIDNPLDAPVAFVPAPEQQHALRAVCTQLAWRGLLRMVFTEADGALQWARQRALTLGFAKPAPHLPLESSALPGRRPGRVRTDR